MNQEQQWATIEYPTDAAPKERYRSPDRRQSARQPLRALVTHRFNRKLWQGLRADAKEMDPKERERIGMPADLPEQDRTPGRHGAWMKPRERRALTRDLKRARMEDLAKREAAYAAQPAESFSHDQVIQDEQPTRAL